MEKDKLSRQSASSMAARLKACGHPVRLRLLCAIEAQRSPGGRSSRRLQPASIGGTNPCVGELSECLGISQPVISQHLAVLKRAGIVCARVSGNRRIYSIKDPVVRAILRDCLTAGR